MLSDLSSLRRIVDQAAKTGHELGIIGFGAEGWCAFCSAQTEDANFTAWLANEVRYALQKNIKLSAYTLMQGNGWGMDPIPEEAKILNRDGCAARRRALRRTGTRRIASAFWRLRRK